MQTPFISLPFSYCYRDSCCHTTDGYKLLYSSISLLFVISPFRDISFFLSPDVFHMFRESMFREKGVLNGMSEKELLVQMTRIKSLSVH